MTRTPGVTVPVRIDPDPMLPRLAALNAAALVYQGRAHDVGTEAILLAADDFAAWLRDGPLPTGEAWLPTGDPAPPGLRPVTDRCSSCEGFGHLPTDDGRERYECPACLGTGRQR